MDYRKSIEERVEWIKSVLASAHADGIVLGMSGGKDSALVGILARMATPNVTGIIMPCQSSRNYGEDRDHALLLNEKFDIKTLEVDLTPVKEALNAVLIPLDESQTPMAYANVNPRLRMLTLYNYAQRKNYLVAGTGNRSEFTMGYFTKWGDGAFDLNPITDLTATEVFEMLRHLDCPSEIIDKAPSAGLFEGQTDEKDMGITYKDLDTYLLTGVATPEVKQKVDNTYARTAHKRAMGKTFKKLN
ncbi:MAG: NAD(+) synthase [Clostridia bacterium]|nr:NAD(+) synthase [Clostridia bacterium]